MDQNTNTAAVKKSSPVDIYSYLTARTIHVAIEVIVACVLFAYFQRKMNKQRDHYEARIAEVEKQVKTLAGIVDELAGARIQKQVAAPEHKRDSKRADPVTIVEDGGARESRPPMAMNFLQEFMKGSMGAMFEPSKPLSSIEEVIDESEGESEVKPISREQLDSELAEELGELKDKS